MLTADLGSAAAAVRELVWNGTPVTARADAWIVSVDTPVVGIRAGWTAAPLGQGFFSMMAPGVSAADVSAWATSTAGVRYVEPDAVITTSATPNDPSLRQLWGLNNTAQTGGVADADIDAPEAWDVATGSRSVVVAIIDTGIDYRHADLAANIWQNPGEVAGDRIDNDGNGFIDDVNGWDFANNDADPFDDQGHGTHVAGTIGAVGNNGVGVAGVNWQVSMIGLKFLGADGSGTTSAAIAAVNYATRMRRDFGINIVATNNSWGGGGPSTALRDAIAAGEGAGILFIAAAGNEANNNDSSASYPANYASISVAATDSSNRLASFSSYGATTVDVAAPGVSITSTTPNNSYSSYSGTSMATPHVAGLVALLAAANPEATAAQIRSSILSTAVPVSSLAGRVATGGLINARAALDAIGSVTPPEPPAPPPTPTDPDEPNDSQATASALALVSGAARASGVVGDGAYGAADVDFYVIALAAGETLTVDIDAATLATPSALDSYVRIFNAAGTQVAFSDDSGGSYDSLATYTASASGTYYVGISAYGNSSYSPTAAGSGSLAQTTGDYTLTVGVTAAPVLTPVADVIDVSPDPRTTAVSAVVVQFSVAVAGFDAADLSLTRGGFAVSLDGVTVSTTDNVRWTVNGLATATTTAGTYVLTVVAAGSGIASIVGGVGLAASASATWVTQAAAIVDAGDTLRLAAVVSATSGELRLSGRIGDGSSAARDVDMYRVRLAAGQTLVIDIDAASLSGGSTLDSYVRLFNASGQQVTRNDDSGGSADSYLSYRAAAAGTFYVGISGFGNASYSPTRAGSGRNASTGVYSVRFAFSSTAGGRTAAFGMPDVGSASAAASAFAVYGANWMAALPAAPGANRVRRGGV